VKGNPFLRYQLELLARFGLRRVLMLVAYLGEKIEAHFGTGRALGIELAYCYEPTPLGTGGALKNAEAQLESEFIVLNGDTYLPIDYRALLRSIREQNTCAKIVAYRPSGKGSSEAGSLPSNLAVSAGGRVTAYRKRDPRGLTHVDAGVLVLRKEVLNKIPRSRACSLEEEVFPQMIAEGQMEAWVTSVPFYDMGTPAGLEALAARLP